jgi:hypothetical protein
MTIRDAQKFVDTLWDWGCLDGCFGDTKIAATDIDGMIERHGEFLVIETKSVGQDIPKGQHIFYDRLAGKPGFTVLIVWGDPGKPQEIMFWGRRRYAADLGGLRRAVSAWFDYANTIGVRQ